MTINGFTIRELIIGQWGTAEGKFIHYNEVTQQHWSNIYWYHKYMAEKAEEAVEFYTNSGVFKDLLPSKQERIEKYNRLANFGLAQIIYRFNGQLLDWQPVYKNEKEWYKSQSTRKVLIEKV